MRPDENGGKVADHHGLRWVADAEHAVSTDPDVIAGWHGEWPDTSFAMITGLIEGVDLDVAKGDKIGGLTWWLRNGMSATPPGTLRTRTRSGGLHIVWRARADGRTLGTYRGPIPGVALDVRAAGGLLYAPGAYLVGTDQHWHLTESHIPALHTLDELPDRVLDLIGEHTTPAREELPTRTPEEVAAAREHARTHPAQVRGYAEGALRSICAQIAATGEGGREGATNDGALTMGSLIFHGMIDRPTVETALVEAAMSTGHTRREATDNVWRGLNDGIAKPMPYPNLRDEPYVDPAPILGWSPPIPPRRRGDPPTEAPSAPQDDPGATNAAGAVGQSADTAASATGFEDSAARGDWEDPIPLEPPRKPARFPVEVLPEWLGAYVDGLAEATQTPLDLPACAVLGALSTCAGGHVVVEVREGWREPVNLYLVSVAEPGSRKSAVINAVTAPLYEAEEEIVSRAQVGRVEQLVTREIAVQTAEKAKRAAAIAPAEKRNDLLVEALSLVAEAEGIVVPLLPRMLADDVTPEALASLLADSGGRLSIMSAEGGLFDTFAGRYSKGIPNLDVLLKGHSGDRVKIDRKGRPPEYIRSPALTLLLTVQPSVMRNLARNSDFVGRGLTARVLYGIPESNIGYRRVGAEPLKRSVHSLYTERIKRLGLTLAEWTDPAVLTLAPEAAARLVEIEAEIEPQLRPDEGELFGVRAWAAKLVGAIVRIAGLLHLAADVGPDPLTMSISRATLDAAATIGLEYFVDHARAAYGLLGTTEQSDAAYVLAYLAREGIDEFTVRDLHAALPRGRFPDVDTVRVAVAVLDEHEWLTRLPAPERKGPGRPPSPRYRVHPSNLATESTE